MSSLAGLVSAAASDEAADPCLPPAANHSDPSPAADRSGDETLRNTQLRFLRTPEESWVHSFHEQDTVKSQIADMPLLHFNSQTRLDTEIKFYENAIEVKLPKDQDGTLVKRAQFSSSDLSVFEPLLDMFKHARGIKIVPQGLSGAKGIKLVGRLLAMEGNPLPTLDSLGIILPGCARTDVKYDIMPIICAAIKSVTLTSLAFWDCDIFGESGFEKQLFDAIGAPGSLRSLSELSVQVRLDRRNNPYLALFEEGNLGHGLQLLDLSSCSGGEGGHMSLTKAMETRRLPNLQTLNLAETGMGSADCVAYAESMSSGNLPALRSLNFRLNKIGDLGAVALSLAHRSGKVNALTCMDLSYNDIRDKGLIKLANLCNTGPGASSGLISLKLTGNHFTEETFGFLSTMLASGQLDLLQTLDVKWCRNPKKDGFGNPILSINSFAEALVVALAENTGLVCEIEFEWWYWPSLDRLRQQYQKRNRKYAQNLILGPKDPATFGSVYLFGFPEAGKSTLRKSLQRGSFLESLVQREVLPSLEGSTRGIEVCELFIKGKRGDRSVQLTLWDMAGEDYHMMINNAFLLNQGFANSKATTFVIVSRHHDVVDAQGEFKYWLRYIASSCGENILSPRKVFVVINCFRGDSQPLANFDEWKCWLVVQATEFDGYLDVETEPFIIDVRKHSSVKQLKQRLISHAREMLSNEAVPEICHVIQNNLKIWRENTDQFPVMKWENFVQKVQEKKENSEWSDKTVEDATTYLNDSGILLFIHIHCKQPVKKLIILNPDWFCRDILSKMFDAEGKFKSSVINTKDGSFSVTKLGEFFRELHNEWTNSQVEDVVAILICLRLSYTGQDQKMFIPNFIEESRIEESRNNENRIEENRLHRSGPRNCKWAPRKLSTKDMESQWVMGYTVEETRYTAGEAKETSFMLPPIALWHRFQVELGQRPNFNASDNNFLVGKYHITFTMHFMNVFISVDLDHPRYDNPTFHKIYILVEPSLSVSSDAIQDSNTRKECQMDLASSLVEILLDLWNQVCPGVGYVHGVVKPWPAYGSNKAFSVESMNVSSALEFVEKNDCDISLDLKVENDSITLGQLLSKREFEYAVKLVQGNDYLHVVRELMREAVDLEILPQEASTSDASKNQDVRADAKGLITTVCKRLDELECDQDVLRVIKKNLEETKEVRNQLKDVIRTKRDVFEKVKKLGNLLLGDEERVCPRFVYAGLLNSAKWVTLKKFNETISRKEKVYLHFLCEAQYECHGHHQVVDQEGLDVSHLKDWTEKLLPWLEASLMVLFISAKVAANVVDPSLSAVIPNFTTWHSIINSITLATGYSQQELDELSEDGIWTGAKSTFKSSQEVQDLVRKAMKEFLGHITLSEVEKKLGLQKVHLHDGLFEGVVWICKDCYKKYGRSRIRNVD